MIRTSTQIIVGCILTWTLKSNFWDGVIKLPTESSRPIKGNDPHNVKLYVNAMWQYLEGQQYWKKRSDLIKSKEFNKKNTEKVHKIFVDASIFAEQRCKRRNRVWWLLPLAQAKFMLYALQSQLLMLHCGHPGHKQVLKYGITIQCPDKIDAVIKQLRTTQKEIKGVFRKAIEKCEELN
eukprot:4004614-Ditylum_brightwellii.AAC.2